MKIKEDSKIAHEARLAVEKWREYFKYNIDQYHQLFQFVMGKQWEDDEEDMLITTLNKVPLQFNKLATLVNTLLGEQQQNTPQLEVNPLSNCDEETAEIRQTVVKDIMLSTDSKTHYQIAANQAFTGGFGCFIVETDYSHDKSFDQDIMLRTLKDATRAYWDLGAEDINKTDGMRAGYITRMTRKKFAQVYGKDVEEKIGLHAGQITQSEDEIALAVQPTSGGDDPFTWYDDDSITIIHDYERTYAKDMLYKLSNGRVCNQEEMDELIMRSRELSAQMQAEQAAMMGEYAGIIEPEPEMSPEDEEFDERVTLIDEGQIVRIEEKRESKRSKIMHRLIAGDYILDESEAPCEDLPVIFVDQNSFYDKNGKQVCRPFVIDAVDAQRYLNYLGTQVAYLLKISRYDQFIGSKKNVQSPDTQAQWKDPQSIKGMLVYDESPSGAKPEQLRPPELSQTLIHQYERAIEDMYTSTGLYPSRMGQQGNEVSGAAIDARTRQGSYSTFVAFNSINRAITAGGKIINQMLPRVYDTQRVLNLMTPDRGRQTVIVNQQEDDYGVKVKNDLTKGTFEVRLQAGPSYEGQKQQALESLNAVLAANPQAFPLIADLYAENLPLMNTIELKNRLKTIVPPEIIEAGKKGEMPQKQQQPDPEAMKAQAEAQFKQEQIAIKKQQLQMEMQELQMKMEMQQKEHELKQLEMLSALEGQKLSYMAETDRTRSDNAIAHADNITKLLTHNIKAREALKHG